MNRKICALLCAIVLTGCERNHAMMDVSRGLSEGAVPDAVVPPIPQQFSYSNSWILVMAHDAVASRFERARAKCLEDRSLNCKLVSASLTMADGTSYSFTSANLDVLLPHGKIAAFEKALLEPVAGENAGDATVQSHSTQADSVETEAGDAGRKVARLTAYRDRLAALAKRPNLSIDDVIKLEAEQSSVQTDLDQAIGTKRNLDDSIARERVSVMMQERASLAGPIARVWRNGTSLFLGSVADVLQFLILVVPWLPVIAAGIYLVSWLWRLFQRRRKVIVPSGNATRIGK
jgi:hypothetical protein